MSIIKVSIFQKSLKDRLELSKLNKLRNLKSDFLIFPEYFYCDDSKKSIEELKKMGNDPLDLLLKLSEDYKGIIAAGGLIVEGEGSLRSAAVLISKGDIIDWYYKRKIDEFEKEIVHPGEGAGVFILSGNRFSILLGEEIYDEKFLKEISDMGIHWIINLSAGISETSDDEVLKIVKERNLSIVRCVPSGTFLGKNVSGKSIVYTPAGISWKVSESEENTEILKTLSMNVHM